MPPCSVVKRTLSSCVILPLAITASNAQLHMYGYSGMHSHVGVENCCLDTHDASRWRLRVSHVWCQTSAALHCQSLGNGDRLRVASWRLSPVRHGTPPRSKMTKRIRMRKSTCVLILAMRKCEHTACHHMPGSSTRAITIGGIQCKRKRAWVCISHHMHARSLQCGILCLGPELIMESLCIATAMLHHSLLMHTQMLRSWGVPGAVFGGTQDVASGTVILDDVEQHLRADFSTGQSTCMNVSMGQCFHMLQRSGPLEYI